MGEVGLVFAATAAFVGTHFLLSHPLRRPLVATVGETPFLGIYSLVSMATLAAMVWTYRSAPSTPMIWTVGELAWGLATLMMLVASVLLIGSLMGNPALPTGGTAPQIPMQARGVFAVTRHPMMWSFALWGLAHIMVFPVSKNIVVSGGIIILALVGAALQDQKKSALQPAAWHQWEGMTSYWPFAAVLDGRAKFSGLSLVVWLGGLILWLTASWAHIPLSGWPAGVWRWINL